MRSLPSLSITARIALKLCLQRRQVNAEVFRDPLDRRTRFAVPRDAHDVVRELTWIGLRHNDILPGCPPGQANSDATCPCSRPKFRPSDVNYDHYGIYPAIIVLKLYLARIQPEGTWAEEIDSLLQSNSALRVGILEPFAK